MSRSMHPFRFGGKHQRSDMVKTEFGWRPRRAKWIAVLAWTGWLLAKPYFWVKAIVR